VSSTRHTPRHTATLLGPAVSRDAEALRLLVDCKYLSARQLQNHLFHSTITAVRRSIRRLEQGGWIQCWESFAPIGGRTKYALPTRTALTWALARKREECAPDLRLVAQTLITTTRRRPVRFRANTTPLFFLHQVATNEVLLGLRSALGGAAVWATAWDRMLPKRIGAYVPPQPDAILIIDREGSDRYLLFIEMDRATQKVADFVSGKSRYGRFALQPGLLLNWFGVPRFQTLVVVDAATPRGTAQRITQLEDAARSHGFRDVVSFVAFRDLLDDPRRAIALVEAAVDGRAEPGSATDLSYVLTNGNSPS